MRVMYLPVHQKHEIVHNRRNLESGRVYVIIITLYINVSKSSISIPALLLEWNCVTRLTLFILLAACAFGQTRPGGLYAVFHTSAGNFTARLYEKETPNTVENFVALAQGTKATRSPKNGEMVRRPLYDNITFHRVVRGE